MNGTSKVIQHFRRTVLLHDGAGLTDGKLLECFIERRDEAAFAALVKRHAPMVWGVCHRLLNHHDAEDAFQATFLVLIRKAPSIKPREMVGNWLYGVAHQTALQARRTAARRKAKEKQVTEMPETEAVQQDLWDDLVALLDQELSRLPDKYRVVIVLCDLEGKTRKETAKQLGCPEGTVAGQLARARSMLAKRLSRHGLVVSGGLLATMLHQKAASAGVPSLVLSSTIKAASVFAAAQAVAVGALSVEVAALIEGVLKMMLLKKLKIASVMVLMLMAGLTASEFVYRTHAADSPKALRATEKAGKNKVAEEEKPIGVAAGVVGSVPPPVTPAGQSRKGAGEIPLPPGTVIQVGSQDSHSTGAFFAVAFSPDGKRLVSGYHAPPFRLWDVATGKEADQFPGHQEPVFAVAFSPDGKYLASGGYDGTVRLWNVNTHEQLFLKSDHQRKVQSTVGAVAFSPDGKILASGAMDQTIRLWEVPSGKSLGCLRGHDYYVMELSFSPDGETLASAGWDMTVRLWDVATGKEMRRFKGHRGGISSVAYSPNRQVLVSASHDKTIRFWRVSTGKEAGHPIELSNEIHST